MLRIRRAPSTFCIAILAGSAFAQEAPRPPPLRKTLSTWYEVDPAWPKVPAGVGWGDMPGIAVDSKDQVWVFTRAVPPVQVYDQDGKLVKSWGTDIVKRAHHIKIDSQGDVWLADIGHHTVFQLTPDGKLLKTLGTKGAAGADRTHFNQPTDMAITPGGDVFVSDGYGNNRVVHLDRDGRFVKEWGKQGVAPGEFNLPHAIALDSKGSLYVADRSNARVQVFSQQGKLLAVWKDLVVPWGFWVTKDDDIWVCGSSPMPWRPTDQVLGCPPKDQVFLRLSTAGQVLQVWTVPKGEDGHEKPGDCNWVHAVALDSKGNIYAGDIVGHRAQRFLKREPEAK